MGSLEILSYFWSLNTILVVQIENFDFGGLSHTPTIDEIFFFFEEEEEEEKTALSFWTSNPLCKNSVANTEHQALYN